MSDWYCLLNDVRIGPVSKNDLEKLADNKTISSTTLVWSPGMDEWKTFGEINPEVTQRSTPGTGSAPRAGRDILMAIATVLCLGSAAGWWFGVEAPKRAAAARMEQARQAQATADAEEAARLARAQADAEAARLAKEKADAEEKQKQMTAQAEAARMAKEKADADEKARQMAAEAERKRMAAMEEEQKQKVAPLTGASKTAPFSNTLGMKFVPVKITGGPTGGKPVLFSVWDTRVKDYAAYAKAESITPQPAKFEQTDDHPVVQVSWEDAQAFCAWLTTSEQAAGRLPASYKYRLPSDHEWSCAIGIGEMEDASASPKDKNGKIFYYPWGDAWPPPQGIGNYNSNPALDSFVFTSPVGSFPADRNGLYDLSGNVWQWCEDLFGAYAFTRVARGASWLVDDGWYLRSSCRVECDQRSRDTQSFGFRCVLVVSGG